ncbi:cysteine methyltransferase [bacterium]|nr:cysteine methyltransferase [bacterium]|tara:strand:- start:387 stop:689 length:303 start_codon:yes stop_codon:yes gene_type:complete
MTSFQRRVLRLVKKIPSGQVATYEQLARMLGRPGAARAVGSALNKNPHLVSTPCHRVVCSDGRLCGYAVGQDMKSKLLSSEGVSIRNGKLLSLKRYLWQD